MAKQKFYVVWNGTEDGVYTSWEACKEAVEGFSGAKYQAFKTEAEAEEAFEMGYEAWKEHKKELGIRNEELGRSRSLEVSTPEGVANTAEIERKRRINKVSKSRSLENGFRLKISVGHLRTLETLGPDYEAVPTDTASYQRRFIVYPVTVGGGYEWTVWSDEWRVGVSAEVGVALCYEKWRRVLSMTATDVWLEDIGLTGWVPAARVDAEVRLWDHVGVGVGVRWIGGGIWSDECGVMSDELGIRNEELGIRNSSFIIHHSTLKNRLEITEHVDRKRGELGGFGGAMWSVELRYWF